MALNEQHPTPKRRQVTPSIGCFTQEQIKKGQIVWVFDKRIDIIILASEIPSLPRSMKTFLQKYGYSQITKGEEVIVLCGDHSRHMNHAEEPNLINGSNNENIAARDIAIGEELTCNYFDFDLDAASKVNSSK